MPTTFISSAVSAPNGFKMTRVGQRVPLRYLHTILTPLGYLHHSIIGAEPEKHAEPGVSEAKSTSRILWGFTLSVEPNLHAVFPRASRARSGGGGSWISAVSTKARALNDGGASPMSCHEWTPLCATPSG